MQVQDEVLLASATIWDLDCPTAVAWPRTEAPSLTGIAHPNAVLACCLIYQQQFRVVMQQQMGRCA